MENDGRKSLVVGSLGLMETAILKGSAEDYTCNTGEDSKSKDEDLSKVKI